MPHLHLSLQAGDDLILKRMKRRHIRADAVRFCDEARRLRPDMAFGADLIAGFPTETEAMFESALGLVEECGLTLSARVPVLPRAPAPPPHACRRCRVQRSRSGRAAARRAQRPLSVIFPAQVGREVES